MQISIDKLYHWAFGFILSIGVLFNPWLIIPGIVFAFGKEVYDKRFDPYDVIATLVGVLTAFLLTLV